MKSIRVGKSDFAWVSDADFDRLSKFKWHLRRSKSGGPYAYRIIYMHREVCRTERQVDHRNGDTLCNLRSNLRPATQQQNIFNARKRRGASSVFKGVCFHKPTGLWRAYITHNQKHKSLGYWTSETLAAKAYNRAAKKFFKSFARLNKI